MACIITHNVDNVQVMASILKWVHPHTTMRAVRFGISVSSIVICTNRKWSSCQKNFLVSHCIMLGNSLTKILNQIGQNLVGGTLGRVTHKSATWLIFIVEIDTVEVVLINVLENSLDLILIHSSAWEWESSTTNAKEHFYIWTFLSQFLEAKLQVFWIWCRELRSQTINIIGIVIV